MSLVLGLDGCRVTQSEGDLGTTTGGVFCNPGGEQLSPPPPPRCALMGAKKERTSGEKPRQSSEDGLIRPEPARTPTPKISVSLLGT